MRINTGNNNSRGLDNPYYVKDHMFTFMLVFWEDFSTRDLKEKIFLNPQLIGAMNRNEYLHLHIKNKCGKWYETHLYIGTSHYLKDCSFVWKQVKDSLQPKADQYYSNCLII